MIPALGLGTEMLPVTTLMEGCVAFAALLIIILIEAVVLRRLMPGVRSFRDSVVMNSASAAAALPVLIGWTFPKSDQPHGPISGYLSYALQSFELLAVTWALSVIVEGLVLYLLERNHLPRQILRASILVNAVSYGLLALILAGDLAVRILTQGDRGVWRGAGSILTTLTAQALGPGTMPPCAASRREHACR